MHFPAFGILEAAENKFARSVHSTLNILYTNYTKPLRFCHQYQNKFCFSIKISNLKYHFRAPQNYGPVFPGKLKRLFT